MNMFSARIVNFTAACLTAISIHYTAAAAEVVWAPEDKNGNSFKGIGIIGRIEKGDFAKFIYTLKFNDGMYQTVYVDSPGGDLREAMRIGRYIRKFYMKTQAPDYLGRHPIYRFDETNSSDLRCASACFFLWAAGVERGGFSVGIHGFQQMFGDIDTIEIEVASNRYVEFLAEAKQYLREMEIPERFINIFEETPPSDIYVALLGDSENKSLSGTIPSIEGWLKARCRHPSREEMILWERRRQSFNKDVGLDRKVAEISNSYLDYLDCAKEQISEKSRAVWSDWSKFVNKIADEIEKKEKEPNH